MTPEKRFINELVTHELIMNEAMLLSLDHYIMLNMFPSHFLNTIITLYQGIH